MKIIHVNVHIVINGHQSIFTITSIGKRFICVWILDNSNEKEAEPWREGFIWLLAKECWSEQSLRTTSFNSGAWIEPVITVDFAFLFHHNLDKLALYYCCSHDVSLFRVRNMFSMTSILFLSLHINVMWTFDSWTCYKLSTKRIRMSGRGEAYLLTQPEIISRVVTLSIYHRHVRNITHIREYSSISKCITIFSTISYSRKYRCDL